MKTTEITTTPVNRLKRLIGLTPQLLEKGDKVDVYNGITGNVAYSGVIMSLYSDGVFKCGSIKEANGIEHHGNCLGTTKKVN